MKQLLAACLVLLVGPTSLAPAQDVIRTFQPEPDAVIVPEPEPRPGSTFRNALSRTRSGFVSGAGHRWKRRALNVDVADLCRTFRNLP